MPTAEEFAALQKALAQATQTSESLAGELRITRAERDLLKEQLNKFKRQLRIPRDGGHDSTLMADSVPP